MTVVDQVLIHKTKA